MAEFAVMPNTECPTPAPGVALKWGLLQFYFLLWENYGKNIYVVPT